MTEDAEEFRASAERARDGAGHIHQARPELRELLDDYANRLEELRDGATS
jgi:hypothetical protein